MRSSLGEGGRRGGGVFFSLPRITISKPGGSWCVMIMFGLPLNPVDQGCRPDVASFPELQLCNVCMLKYDSNLPLFAYALYLEPHHASATRVHNVQCALCIHLAKTPVNICLGVTYLTYLTLACLWCVLSNPGCPT